MRQIDCTQSLTMHAAKRMQQRCISTHDVEVMMTYGDWENRVDRKTMAISMTRQEIECLAAEGVITKDAWTRFNKLTLLISQDRWSVVTTIWRTSRGKRYFRPISGR